MYNFLADTCSLQHISCLFNNVIAFSCKVYWFIFSIFCLLLVFGKEIFKRVLFSDELSSVDLLSIPAKFDGSTNKNFAL